MTAAGDHILSRRTAAMLILVGGAAFCAFLALAVLIDPADRTVIGSSSYSRSALGHAGFATLLRDAGYDVAINRSRRGRGIAPDDVLLILEPNLRSHVLADLERLMEGKRRVLVALPKWQPQGASSCGWIAAAELLPKRAAREVADGVVGAEVQRPEGDNPWTDGLGTGDPTIDNTLQLVGSDQLKPLVSKPNGMLAGETRQGDAQIVVLADPDIIANHGLHRGNNARLALGLVARLAPSTNRPVHFDETLHGFASVPSLPRLLVAPPLLAATLLALATVAVVVWRAAVGFGTPRSTAAAPVLGSGHETLLHNAGRLLTSADHAVYIADRYGRASLAEAGRRLHLDGRTRHGETDQDADLRDALENVAKRRGIRTQLPNPATRPLARARRYYDWMEEMFGGPGSNRDAR